MDGEFVAILPPGSTPNPAVAALLLQLESAEWKPRKVIGAKAIRYWRDDERSRQITIDLYYPPNEHKLEFLREHTQLDLVVSTVKEG